MSHKQKIFAGILVLAVVGMFGFVYSRSSKPVPAQNVSAGTNFKTNKQIEQKLPESVVVTATPDAAVDAIINDASLDDKALQDESASEQDAVTASGADINNLTQTYDDQQDTRQAASCDQINTMGQNHFQQFSEKKSTFEQNFGDKMTAFEDRRDSNDAKLNDGREQQDERRNEMYMKLGDLAKTDDQKAAVEAFQKTVDQAVTDRRSAVSEAIDAFRKDVDTLVATKKSSVRVSVDTFQESTKTAFDKAKTDCSSGVDPKTVRDTLTTSLKDARTKLETNRQSFEGLGKSIPAIASAKKTSIDKAMQDFKTTMEKARTDLKAALQ